jgi:dTDP-4-dehydrorhamnose 3,5-epimerase
MKIRELSIADSYEFTPRVFPDDRGLFLEAFRLDALEEATGRSFGLAQVNTSVSRRGVVRGIHYADLPPGQGKFVMASDGAVLDFIVDLRVGSPTFGEWDLVLLGPDERKAVFLPEGLGHAFVALSEIAVVTYLVTSPYDPVAEHGVDPLDSRIDLRFPEEAGELILSPKDTDAPTLDEAIAAGALPTWEACQAWYAKLRAEG